MNQKFAISHAMRHAAIEILSLLKNPISKANTPLDDAIKTAEFEELIWLLASNEQENCLQACRNIIIAADALSVERCIALLPKIAALLQDANSDVRTVAAKAFIDLVARLPLEQSLAHIRPLLEHQAWEARQQACLVIVAMIQSLSLEDCKTLLPKITALLLDALSEVRTLAHQVTTALLARLSLEQSLAHIRPLLEHQAWKARQQACLVIVAMAERLSLEDCKTLLPKIATLLQDNDHVRAAAAKAFIALSARLPLEQSLALITPLLEHQAWIVRKQACLSIAKMAESLALEDCNTLLPKITALLLDADSYVRTAAAKAFIALSARLPIEQGLAHITPLLEHQAWEARQQACLVIVAMIQSLSLEDCKTLLPKITALLLDAVSDVRTVAHQVTTALLARPPQEQVLTLITPLLGHQAWIVRKQACLSIAKMAESLALEDCTILLPKIATLLRDNNSDVRTLAGQATIALSARLPIEQGLARITPLLEHQSWIVRQQACLSIAKMAQSLSLEDCNTLLLKITALLQDDSSHVRTLAGQITTALSARLPIEQGLARITPLLEHQSLIVIEEACLVIAEIAQSLSPEDCTILLPKIATLLQDNDSDVRTVAGQATIALSTRLPLEQGLARITPLLEHQEWTVHEQACLSIAKMAQSLSLEDCTILLPKIAALLQDANSDVRTAAAKAFIDLVARLPQEQYEQHVKQIAHLLDTEPAFARNLSLIAQSFSTQAPQNLLPTLLKQLTKPENSPYIYPTLRCYISRLHKDSPWLLFIRDEISKLMLSQDPNTRKAALEIASFPTILELWTKDNLPTAEYSECLNLQKIQTQSRRLWPEKFAHLPNADETPTSAAYRP